MVAKRRDDVLVEGDSPNCKCEKNCGLIVNCKASNLIGRGGGGSNRIAEKNQMLCQDLDRMRLVDHE